MFSNISVLTTTVNGNFPTAFFEDINILLYITHITSLNLRTLLIYRVLHTVLLYLLPCKCYNLLYEVTG